MRITAPAAAVFASGLLLVATAGSAAAAARSAPPPVSGCPAAAQVIGPVRFAQLTAQGYQAPTRADINGDLTVCAIPFNDTAATKLCPDCPSGFYLFSDNTYPGRH